MKKILLFIVILLFSTGCSNNLDKKELNVLNWSSYIPSEVILDFEKETGISVNYGTYSSNEELLAKVSNVASGTYDLVFPSDYMVEIMKEKGILLELDKSKLKNLGNLNENYLNPVYDKDNKYSLPFLAASVLIAVNKFDVNKPIYSYNDLLDPSLKGKIVLIDDQRIVIGIALLANGFDMNSVNPKELEIAKDWLLKLDENVKAYDSDSPKNFLISREASVALLWNAEASLATNENSMIHTIFPKEGFAKSVDNFVILKGSKNTDEAYQFIDYILRSDVMKKIIESYPYTSVNKETEKLLSESYLNNKACNIPDEVMNEGIFVKNIGKSIKEYDKIWIKIK